MRVAKHLKQGQLGGLGTEELKIILQIQVDLGHYVEIQHHVVAWRPNNCALPN